MRTILRKCAIGAVAVGGLLLVQPGNFANAAQNDGTRAAVRKCINANQKARTTAENQFRKDIKAARALPSGQQQAAVTAAQQKFQTAAEQAHTAFNSCIAAANPNP